jgi:hypothetical protein
MDILMAMFKNLCFFLRVVGCSGLILASAVAQSPQAADTLPNQPFQAVHLISIPAAGEKAVMADLADTNAAIVKAGCSSCVYHLWKVAGTQTGVYNYIRISSWPGRDVYIKVHSAAEYKAAIAKHPEVEPYYHAQVYNRYVEVPVAK